MFLLANEADFLQGFLKNKYIKLAPASSVRYIDDFLSVNKFRLDDYWHLIYQNKLDVKDTIETQSARYLDIYPEIGNRGRLKTKLYVKRDDFTFPMVNFPPSVVICNQYQRLGFSIPRHVPRIVISEQNSAANAKAFETRLRCACVEVSLEKVYDRYHEFVDRYEISISQMVIDVLPFT